MIKIIIHGISLNNIIAAVVSTVKPATGETVNVGAIVGGVLGGLALIGIIVIIIIIIVGINTRKQRSVDLGSTKRYSSYTVSHSF